MSAQYRFFPLSAFKEDVAGRQSSEQSPEKSLGQMKLADFILACQEKGLNDIESCLKKSRHEELLCAIFTNSPYLSNLLMKDVVYAHHLLKQNPDHLFAEIINKLQAEIPLITDTENLKRKLRNAKSRVALITSYADLTGHWHLDEITASLSKFAETAVSLSVAFLIKSEMDKGNLAYPKGHTSSEDLCATEEFSRGSGYVVLAMGKLGGYELNYSSDIDLIILFDNDIVQYTGKKSAHDLFVKMTRSLVQIMQERTADGYVFRTDLRLRPDPGATAVALSMEAAEIYYQSVGLNWERAAMIKARPIAGDLKAGYDFLDRIKSFIWRKHLDYAALEDIYAIKNLTHQYHRHGGIQFPGQDVKLGRGGIREIEFTAQIHQLLSGGRDPDLRIAPTCKALNALEKTGKISAPENKILQEAYLYLRTLEHRLQMINDDQTHSMPESPEDLLRISHFMGYCDINAFETELLGHLHRVHDFFSKLLRSTSQNEQAEENLLHFPVEDYDRKTLNFIQEAGYSDSKAIYDLIRNWFRGRYRACRTDRARKILITLIPDILKSFSIHHDPDACFRKFDDFLSRLPSGVQLFSFIKAQPWLLKLLSEIIGMAPKLSEQLARRPHLLDAVLNADFFNASLSEVDVKDVLESQLSLAQDFQDILDISRIWANEHKFQIGVQILRNSVDPRTASKNLTILADIILNALISRVQDEFSKKHGQIKGGSLAVLAMGKLGGYELTPTSDLDLIFIYDADGSCTQSDGPKALSINHYFARLSQNIINALTALTGEGKLYEVDMRLRPSGTSGPIAVKIETFAQYQQGAAWTWEHMALTRGRVCCGPKDLKEKIEGIIHKALCAPSRDKDKLCLDVAVMRQKMRLEFGNNNIWAMKHAEGGLLDIEFICQYLLLKNAPEHPEILENNILNTISALIKHKILDQKTGKILFEASHLMQSLQLILRLCMGSSTKSTGKPKELVEILLKIAHCNSLQALEEKISQTKAQVFQIYQETIETPAEKMLMKSADG